MKIGIDWGGTKIEGIAIDSSDGNESVSYTHLRAHETLR